MLTQRVGIEELPYSLKNLIGEFGCALAGINELQGLREHAGCPIGGPLMTRRREYVVPQNVWLGYSHLSRVRSMGGAMTDSTR